MVSGKLKDCWLKIERSKDHRGSLQRYIVETIAADGNRPGIVAKFDNETGEYVLSVSHVPDLGNFIDRCSIVFGEAINSLFSAINYLAYRLAELDSGGNFRHTRPQFPIADTPENFEELRKRFLVEISPEHVAILERYQGYHRGDIDYSCGLNFGFHPLSMLRDLASTDKHRMPIQLMTPTAILQGMTWSPFSVEILDLMRECVRLCAVLPAPVKFGAEVCRVQFPGKADPDMEVNGYFTPEVTLTQGQPIVHVVDRIAPVVVKIVREFEPVF
jgi:hypothetical protein